MSKYNDNKRSLDRYTNMCREILLIISFFFSVITSIVACIETYGWVFRRSCEHGTPLCSYYHNTPQLRIVVSELSLQAQPTATLLFASLTMLSMSYSPSSSLSHPFLQQVLPGSTSLNLLLHISQHGFILLLLLFLGTRLFYRLLDYHTILIVFYYKI